MVKPTLNRDRLAFLNAVDRRDVYRHTSGYDMRKRRTHLDERVDRRVREALAAEWITLGTDGIYALTDQCRADLTAAPMP